MLSIGFTHTGSRSKLNNKNYAFRVLAAFTLLGFSSAASAGLVFVQDPGNTDFQTATSGLTVVNLDLDLVNLGAFNIDPTPKTIVQDGRIYDFSNMSDGPFLYEGTSVTWWPNGQRFLGTDTNSIIIEVGFNVQAISFDVGVKWSSATLTFYENPGCTSVPEPGSLSLLGAGLIGFGLLWRFRKRDAGLA